MTKRKKIGGLLLLLAIPVVILIFLEQFGQQHYTVPTDPSEAEGLSAEVPAGSLGKKIRWEGSLVDRQGKAVSDQRSGQTIIYPIRNTASDTALAVLEKLTRVQNVFEQEERVQILAILNTTSPDTLATLARRYRNQEGRWLFLADTSQTNVSASLRPPGTPSSTVILVDQDQIIRGYYDGMQEDEIDRLVVETRILLYSVK